MEKWRKWLGRGGIGLLLAAALMAIGVPASLAGSVMKVRLLYATFDPIGEGEPAVPVELRASPASPYGLLQFHGPIRADWGSDLAALGVTFYDYLADFTYVVHVPAASRDAVAAHPAVRWLGAYHPAYKLSPTLQGGKMVVALFDAAAVPALQLAGATIVEQRLDGADPFVVLQAAAPLIPALAAIDGVRWLQNAAPIAELNDDARWVTQGNLYRETPLYDHGLSGAGQVGAVADSGLSVYPFPGTLLPQTPSCYFLDDANGGAGGAPLLPGVDHRKVVAYTIPAGAISDFEDGSGHGSHVVGSVVGDRAPWSVLSPDDGQAYNARIYFQDVGIGPGLINPPSDYNNLFGPAYDPNGDGIYQPADEPRTHSNSWGSADPIYSLESATVDRFMWSHPDFLILYAIGNNGPVAGTTGYPATAKNIVSVGAGENGLGDPDNMGYFSGHGPASTGRLAPAVSAPGDRISSALANNPCGVVEKTGSSMATPAVQGVSLLMRQYLWDGYYPSGRANPADRRHPSAALLKALLMNSGRPMSGDFVDNTNSGSWPANGQGWGRVTADDALYFAGDRRALWLQDEYALDGSAGFGAAGQSQSFTIEVAESAPFPGEPLEITLVWSDYPGAPPAGGPLVNDLSLTVTGPNGTIHLGNDAAGNDFRGQAELPPVTPLLRDAINPWEVVYLENPAPGAYTIEVAAANLGSLLLDPGRRQGYALVVAGDLLSTQSRLAFDAPAYDLPGAAPAVVRLSDSDLNANPAAVESVQVALSALPSGQSLALTLVETGPDSAVFAATVTLTTGSPAAGQLQVTAGGTLQALHAASGASAGAVIRPRPLTFGGPPALGDPTGGASFDLTWSAPPETADLVGYTLQESTIFARPLFDDAEGAITTNWVAGDLLAPWSQDGSYKQSGAASFYSGRGDANPGLVVNTSLTLNHDVTISPAAESARLTFYSRYANDLNDKGHVEISTDGGGSWAPLLILYADPFSKTLGTAMAHYQVELSDYIGAPFRLRFRYDNGVFSQLPDSPGWWIDDVVVEGGAWRTVATLGAGVTSTTIANRPAGAYHYRLQARYADGSATPWSAAVDAVVPAITVQAIPTGSTTVGPAGGRVKLRVVLQNNTTTVQTTQVWLEVVHLDQNGQPSGQYAATTQPVSSRVAANSSRAVSFTYRLMASDPAGAYRLTAHSGAYPTGTSSDSFMMTKSAGGAAAAAPVIHVARPGQKSGPE
jgi:hypothetical protein